MASTSCVRQRSGLRGRGEQAPSLVVGQGSEGDDGPLVHRVTPGLLPPGEADEPRQIARQARELLEQLGRRLVHPLGVLDDDDRRTGPRRGKELDHDLVEPRPAEAVLQRGGFGRVLQVDVDDGPDEREEREQRRSDAHDGSPELSRHVLGATALDAEHDPHGVAQ